MKTLSIIVCLFFLSCINKNSISSSESIEVYYMRPYVSTPFSYSCGMISMDALKNDVHFKEFRDSTTISKFIKIYKNYELEAIQDDAINTRIRVIINVESLKDTLCLGENFNTFINGKKFKDKKEMLDFIKKIIDYENTPRPTFPRSND